MKRKLMLPAFAALSMLLFAACTPPAEEAKPMDMDALKVQIQAMEDAFAAAEKAKDAEAVAAYYSDDAVSYSRNQEPAVGKAAIQSAIAQRLAADSSGSYSVYKVVDLFAEGNTAVEVGSWQTFGADNTETEKGFYMSIFQKKGDKYECVRDMNVTTAPIKPAK